MSETLLFDRSYRALSYAFRVRTDLPDIAHQLDRSLSRFGAVDANGGPVYEARRRLRADRHFVLYRNGRSVRRSDSYEEIVDWVLWEVSARAISRARECLAIHAGAVSWNGAGIILPAPQDSGKTTLSAGLIGAGFSYLCDEAALIDVKTGELSPFPRPLSMEPSSVRLIPGLANKVESSFGGPTRRQFHVLPEDLGPGPVGESCPVRYVVAPTYAKGADTDLEPMSRADAVVTMARNSFNLKRFGRRGVRILAGLVGQAACYRLRTGDLSSAVAAVSNLVQEGPA